MHRSAAYEPRPTRGLSADLANAHGWLVIAGCCDFIFTLIVLRLGGAELNPLAAGVLAAGGAWAMAIYKLACGLAIVIGCEWIARQRRELACRLEWAILLLWTLPPLFAAAQLLYLEYGR